MACEVSEKDQEAHWIAFIKRCPQIALKFYVSCSVETDHFKPCLTSSLPYHKVSWRYH